MVEAKGDVHHRPDADQVAARRLDYDGPLDDRLQSHDPDFWRVDDRLRDDRAGPAGVVERERAALDVLHAQLLAARAIGQVADGLVQSVDAERVRVVDDRHYQAV